MELSEGGVNVEEPGLRGRKWVQVGLWPQRYLKIIRRGESIGPQEAYCVPSLSQAPEIPYLLE